MNGACGYLLEQLLDDEAADVSCAYDCKFLEAEHVSVCLEVNVQSGDLLPSGCDDACSMFL